uniref:Uncharacterized protein n=1 Tax=Bos taurus TaxID=9913 RepID=Q56JY5_BOVIN|nr:unknown [Bos taurus]
MTSPGHLVSQSHNQETKPSFTDGYVPQAQPYFGTLQ